MDSVAFNHTSKVLHLAKDRFSIGMSAYANDFLLGLSYNHVLYKQLGLSFKTSLWIRPYLKNILEQENDDTYYIFRENRTQIIAGLEHVIPLNGMIDLHSSLSISPLLFFYMGSNRDYIDLIAPVVEAGLSFKVSRNYTKPDAMRIEIGYRYSREELNRHGIYLMLVVPL